MHYKENEGHEIKAVRQTHNWCPEGTNTRKVFLRILSKSLWKDHGPVITLVLGIWLPQLLEYLLF